TKVALPQLRALVVELPDVVECARVVHEDVDGPELLDRATHGRGDGGTIRDVAAHGGRSPSEVTNFFDGLLRVDDALSARRGRERSPAVRLLRKLGLDQDVRDDDIGPRAREGQRIRATESSRAPGDEGDATREIDPEGHGETLLATRQEDLLGDDEALDLGR